MCSYPQQEMVSALPSSQSQGPVAVQEATADLVDGLRRRQLSENMTALFALCGDRCSCGEETCPLKGGRMGQPSAESPACGSTATCSVCRVFCRHLELCNVLAGASRSRGAVFSRLLASSLAVHQIYGLAVPADLPPERRVQRKQSAKELLCAMLDCERNRLQCVRRIGELGVLLPRLLCVQLSSGRAQFWEQLRRVANTVRGQAAGESKRAALEAIRRRLPADSPWKPFLTPDT